jgi:hypothetical protein
LATPTVPVYDYSHADPSLAGYSSMMLQRYLEILDQNSKAEVLDLGPVCEENIIYFAQRLKRFHVCDMFLRLDLNRRKGLPIRKVWEHLDYTPHSFDGINLWDFIDYLNENEIGSLVKICHILLKPKGMITITSFEAQWAPEKTHSFIIQGGYKVIFRLQDHLDLPRNYYSNRIITEMLSEFPTVKSFIYRNGVREYLCRRD